MAHAKHRALKTIECLLQRFAGFNVQVVGGFVEQEHIVACQLERQNLESCLLAAGERLELLSTLIAQSVTGERSHAALLVNQLVTHNVDALTSAKFGTVIDLGEHAHIGAWTKRNGARVLLVVAIEGVEKVRLAGSIGADESHALTEVDLFIERLEQTVNAHTAELHHTTRTICPAESHENLLVGNRWRRGTRGHKLLPPCLGSIGLGGVLEVLRRARLHHLHVLEQATLFVVPPLQFVTELLLTCLSSLGVGLVTAAVHPTTRTFHRDDLVGACLEKCAVVAHHEDGALERVQLLFEPPARGDV